MFNKSHAKERVPAYLDFLKKSIPTLYLSSGDQKEAQEVFDDILKSNIKCEIHAATDVDRSLLVINYQRFVGLKRIKEFLSSLQATRYKKIVLANH